MRTTRVITAMAVITLSLVAQVQTKGHVAHARSDPGRPIRWLAAGDSYSAGEGLPDVSEPTCQRAFFDSGHTSAAWAAVARKALKPELKIAEGKPYQTGGELVSRKGFDFVACTGAVTEDLFDDHNKKREWDPYNNGRFDLVTFSLGGNNVGFDTILEQCIGATLKSAAGVIAGGTVGGTEGAVSGWLTTAGCPAESDMLSAVAGLSAGGNDKDGAHLPALSDFYQRVARDVVSPGGNVVVVGYPEFVEDPDLWTSTPSAIGYCNALGKSDARILRGIAGRLNQTIGQAVVNANTNQYGVHFTFVDVNTVFEPSGAKRHNLCAVEPWMNGVTTGFSGGDFRLSRSFHPTQDGQYAEGALVAERINNLDWSGLGPAEIPPRAVCDSWSPASDFHTAPKQANPSPDTCEAPEVWTYGTSTSVSPSKAVPFSTFEKSGVDVEGTDLTGVERWYDGKEPFAGVYFNPTERSIATHPAGRFQVHPSSDKPVVVTWRSPYPQTVDIADGPEGIIVDRDKRCGDGVTWSIFVDDRPIASGGIINGGNSHLIETGATTTAITAETGTTISFVIAARDSDRCDTTGLDVKITHRYDKPSKPGENRSLLRNGGFESPQVNGQFVQREVGFEIDGWQVKSGSVDQVNENWVSAQGRQSLDLSGPAPGRIEQGIVTIPGESYTIGFASAGNPTDQPATKDLRVYAGTEHGDFSFDTTGASFTDMRWRRDTFEFVARQATTIIGFESLTQSRHGPALDDVTVTPTPGKQRAESAAGTAIPQSEWRTVGKTKLVATTPDSFRLVTTATFWSGAIASTNGLCDYRFEGEARILTGDGYGFFTRSKFPEATTPTEGHGLQYDPGASGLRDVELPRSESSPVKSMKTDHEWHTIAVEVAGQRYKSFLDGELQFEGPTTTTCGDLYLRVWRTDAEFRNLTIRATDPSTDSKPATSTGTFNDGGFEQPNLNGKCIVALAAGQTIGPWTVGLAGVDHMGSGSSFSSPNQSIDLSALDAGSISQTFDTIAGTTYSVQIDAAANVVGPPAAKTFTVSVDSAGAQPGSYSATKPGGAWCETSAANSNYDRYEYRFAASAATTTLVIASTTAGRFGPVIDNVTVTSVSVK